MNEPRRLLEGEGSELERLLLEAGLTEQPRSRGKRQAAIALAAATGISAFTKWTWAGADLLRLGAAHAGKVVAGTVIVGSTALAVVHGSSTESETPVGQAPAEQTIRTEGKAAESDPVRQELDAVQVEDLPALEEDTADEAQAVPTSPAGKTASSGSIADEIKALDAARQTLAGGNPGKTLQQLNEYSRRFRGGRLGQEAMLIRIEALSRSGQHAQAKAMARRFLAANPRSPYTKRLESIVGEL